ncbi:DUF5317 family protein [Clostridium carnis]
MIETILIALLVSKIKGYKLKGLFKSWEIYLVLFMEISYVIIQFNIFKENYEVIKYANILKVVYLCSYLPLIYKFKQFIYAIIGSISMLFGGVLNNIAIKANGGMMPVFPTISYWTGYVKSDSFSKVNDIHILGNAETKLKYLTDIIDVGYSILSVGDVLIRVYVFLIIYGAIKHINKRV